MVNGVRALSLAEQVVVGTEHVVLLDGVGRPVGTAPKTTVHDERTPFHLAFSCHLVGPDGSLLLTRRAAAKRTWPGAWTNGCCGHPQVGETLRGAVTRRIEEELGLPVGRMALALPDFAYRAVMPDGVVEHELCPVVVVEVRGDVDPDPAEVAATDWVSWADLVERVAEAPASLSPWCVAQVERFIEAGEPPAAWLQDPVALGAAALDRSIVVEVRRQAGRSPSLMPQPDRTDPLGPVADELRELLEPFLAERTASLLDLHPALREVAASIVDLVQAGGKRLRPAFVHWGHRAAGDDRAGVLHAAGAVELLHTFALLHDDVMDRSEQRRGRPAAHVAFANLHEAQLGLGDGGWFGCSAAVLAGDLCHVWADELLGAAPVPTVALDRARQVYDQLRTEVIAGQYLDLRLAAVDGARAADARLVAMLKSARYTVTRPLLLGAALAEPEPDGALLAALRGYGDAVGLAFQLRDDVLGLFGDPSTTGKSDLDDLREGKRTVLVLRAFELADEAGRSLLRAALGDPTVDEPRAATVRGIVADSGALASVEALLASLHDTALAHVARVPEPARAALHALADLAIERTS